MAGVKKDYSLELNLMFQNLKAKELDVIITRKEKKTLLLVATWYASLGRKNSSNITPRWSLRQIKNYCAPKKTTTALSSKQKRQMLEQLIW